MASSDTLNPAKNPSAAPVTLFYSYAHEDEGLRDELQGHLKILERRGLLAPWHDRRIVPGQDWSQQIDTNLRLADLVLLLVSKDFIESDYIMGTELGAAMQRHAAQQTVVVPIVVRAVDLDPEDATDLPFLKLQGLPTNLRPVTSWPNRDEAWTDVAKGLRATVKGIRERRPPPPVHQPAPVAAAAPARSASADPFEAFDGDRSFIRPAAVRPDPVLDRLLTAVSQQVDEAGRLRNEPRLSEAATRDLQAGVRTLIDLPEQKRILWVDDRPDGNRYETAVLAKLQIEVVTALNTAQALQRIDSDAEGFDLVISDWERDGEPAEAGLRLLAALRDEGYSKPVIFYHGARGAQRTERAAQALRAGAFGEAVVPAELMAQVRQALAG
jgi:CheY-like chemotaxis protein